MKMKSKIRAIKSFFKSITPGECFVSRPFWKQGFWLTLFTLVFIIYALPAYSALYIEDTVDSIKSFSREDTGQFVWWNTAICDGEFHEEGVIRYVTNPPASGYGTTAKGCNVNNGVYFNAVTDGTYIYYFVDGELMKKSFKASETSAPLDFSASTLATLPAGQGTSPLAGHEDFLYWSRHQNNYYWIYRQSFDGSTGLSLLAGGDGDPISKIKVVSYVDSRWPEAPITAVIYLESDGSLRLRRIGGDNGQLNLIQHSALNDFTVHSWREVGLGDVSRKTYIYAAIGVDGQINPSTAPGRLERVDIETGYSSIIYQAPNDRQIISVTTDSDDMYITFNNPDTANIYFVEAVHECEESDIFCSYTHNRIYRRNVRASILTLWEQIYLDGHARELVSDDDYLYFTNHEESPSYDPNNRDIYRIKTDKPPIALDFIADGVEIIQNVQNLDGNVYLVANKKTYVRGYGHLGTDTTDIDFFSPSADLYGFVNGVLTADSPIRSNNKPTLTDDTDLTSARSSLAQSWLWEIPNQWLQPGQLQVQMVIDPQQSTPETETTVNNTISSNLVDVIQKGKPCLVYKPVATIGAAPYKHQSFSTTIDDRAVSLLPVQGFRFYHHHSCLKDHYWTFEWEWTACGPFICYVPVPVEIEEPFDFSTSKDDDVQGEVLDELSVWSYWQGSPEGCSDTHFVGTVPFDIPGYSDGGIFNGVSRGDEDLVVRMEFGDHGDLWNSPFAGKVLAHELGHQYGRGHIDCEDPDPPFDVPPFDLCAFGLQDASDPSTHFGFDPISLDIIHPWDAGDLMSYASNQWISKFTYDAIGSKIGSEGFSVSAADSELASRQMLIHGILNTLTDEVSSPLPYILPEGTYDVAKAAASHDAASVFDPYSPYEFVLLDAFGTELVRSKVILIPVKDGKIGSANFIQFLDFPESTDRLQLVKGDTVLLELERSSSAPTVELPSPEIDTGKEALFVQWSAADADGDNLLFTLQYTPDADGGSIWRTLETDYPSFGAAVSTSLLPGGMAAQLRLFATDGMNTSVVYSEPFVLDTHLPQVEIVGVTDGEMIPFGVQVELIANAYDAEDGSFAAEDLDWDVSGDLSMTATGETLILKDLLPGFYQVSLTAEDSAGNNKTGNVAFHIAPLMIPDGGTPVVDGNCGDTAYQDAAKVVIPLTSGGQAEVRLVHSGNHMYACFSDLEKGIPDDLGLFSPTVAGLQIDAVGDGTVDDGWLDDRGFFVDENGLPFQRVGSSRSGMVVTTVPALGSDVYVMRGVLGWSAEFRINEDLLEGWNHRASIMFVHDASFFTDDDSNWPVEAVVSSPLMWAQAQFGEMAELPENRAPVADAGPDQVVGSLNPIIVYLDGRASYDPDSNLLEYQWDQTEGQLIQLTNTQQSVAQVLILPLPETTEYTFELTVNDGELTSIPSQVSVTVYPVSGPIPQSPSSGEIIPPFVTVANPGNTADDSGGFGAVGAIFEIGTTEVTNVFYVMFLNAVAKADSNGLFDERMESDPRGGIIQTGISGSYFYESKPYMSTKPVNYVSWLDAVRFVNWLENDMAEGVQDSLTTEAGAYDLSVFQPGVNAMRNSECQYGLANENQWYKAAFYNPETQRYRSYPLQNEGGPQRAAATGTGNVRNPGDNVINFNNGATWFGMTGNVTSVVSAMASSEYGTYDQSGNVAEWLDGISERGFRITRGGSYDSGADMISSFGRSLRSFDYAGNDVGFRIVVKGSCLGDFNGDGDVDGSDLAHQAGQDTSISVSDFAANYGSTDCI